MTVRRDIERSPSEAESRQRGVAKKRASGVPVTVNRGADEKLSAVGKNRSETIVAVATPVAILSLWELSSRLGLLDPRFFPAPSSIISYFVEYVISGEILRQTGITLYRVFVGFILGAVPGTILGLLAGTNRLVRAGVVPIIGAVYPIPKIAILPLVILVFGISDRTLFVVVAIGVFFPMVINTLGAVLNIDKIYFDVGDNVGASRARQFFTIALPGSIPGIASGIRVAWGMALLILIGSEFIASQSGIGYFIYEGWQTFQVKQLYAGIITISIVGVTTFALLERLEKAIVPWKVTR